MDARIPAAVRMADAARLSRTAVGGKASTLAALSAVDLPVPDGFVVTSSAWSLPATSRADAVGAALLVEEMADVSVFAVRSSAAAEDLSDASYAGQYESFMNVPRPQVAQVVEQCHRAASAARVSAYQTGRGTADVVGAMAVLVQPMIPAVAAGVAFTANPVTGDRSESIVTAVRGLGERLVSGDADGDEWVVRDGLARARRSTEDAITAEQAAAVADLARRVQVVLSGPQDIEWAIEPSSSGWRVVLLQARPMTGLPEPLDWTAPGPGLWMRNFRLGEWLPEPMTDLFADWLLPLIEDGYLAGMRDSVGTTVPFRYAVVNGWYFNAIPVPTPRLLLRAVAQSRGHILWLLYNALIRVSTSPVAADRAVLGSLHRKWRHVELPAYRQLVHDGAAALPTASRDHVIRLVEQVAHCAGRQLWYLAIVGGSAWKMEGRLARFIREHLPELGGPQQPLSDGIQVLLRALPGVDLQPPRHGVVSLDWYWPTIAETRPADPPPDAGAQSRHQRLAAQREDAEAACLDVLTDRPALRSDFSQLLEVARRYTVIREEQARDLTLGWPLLRACAQRLGEQLCSTGALERPDLVFFLTRNELDAPPDAAEPATREARWQAVRRSPAPLTIGRPPRLLGDPIARAVSHARGTATIPSDAITGQPASTGRATGRVRLITELDQFGTFQPGEVLVAKATAPAWTPLFAMAAGVITDGGSMAAHASIVAREYGIPAVVGTGDATHRLRTGQWVTVDGSTGIVTLTHRTEHDGPPGP
jgi:phosphohistidine swiveling domain-containing protein